MAITITKQELLKIIDTGPGIVNIDEVADRYMDKWEGERSKLIRRINAGFSALPGCVRGQDRSMVYLPRFRTGATMVQPYLVQPNSSGETLPVIPWLPEVECLLRPSRPNKPSIELRLDGGQPLKLRWSEGLKSRSSVPDELGLWLARQHEVQGADGFQIHCMDGQRGHFEVRAVVMAETDRFDADQVLREAAKSVLSRHSGGMEPYHLVQKLLGLGLYHGATAPSPLLYTLLHPWPCVYLSWSRWKSASELSLPMMDLLAKHNPEWAVDDETYWFFTGGMTRPAVPKSSPPLPEGAYRIRFKLERYDVSQVIEIGSGDTFADLHDIIISEMGRYNDHMWIFSFLGRPGSPYAGIGPGDDSDWPLDAFDTELGEVGLEVGQTFSYVFDFGDWWEFQLKVLAFSPGKTVLSPVVLEKRGEAPDQYHMWDEEYEDDEEDEE